MEKYYIADADREYCVIANSDGYDVATISRYEFGKFGHEHQYLNDDEWQALIDKIDESLKN